MLKPGTKVRIKSCKEIKKILNNGDYYQGMYFNPDMYKYCGNIYVVDTCYKDSYRLSSLDKDSEVSEWLWHPQWCGEFKEDSILNDDSLEQRSLCLALVRQTMSGNTPDLSIFMPHTNCSCKLYGGFDYQDFPQDDWYHTIARNIPDWPCLKLKPEILEKALCYCLTHHNIDYFNTVCQDPIDFWFTFSGTAEGPEYWRGIVNACNTDKLIINPNKTIESNETELQNKETPVRGGSEQTANRICYRKSKAQFVIRHISHQGSPFRC